MRTIGKSKYGLSRTIRVIFDLMTIKFMASYQTKRLYVFGWAGLLTMLVSLLCAVFAFVMKYVNWPHHADFVQTPCRYSRWSCWFWASSTHGPLAWIIHEWV